MFGPRYLILSSVIPFQKVQARTLSYRCNHMCKNVLVVFPSSSNLCLKSPQRVIGKTERELHLSLGYFGSIPSRTQERRAKADPSRQSGLDGCGSCEWKSVRCGSRLTATSHPSPGGRRIAFERRCALSPFVADCALAASFARICALPLLSRSQLTALRNLLCPSKSR
jgi:hypothetical protein